jgi:hypothetical protein
MSDNYELTIKVWKDQNGKWVAHMRKDHRFNDANANGDTPREAILNVLADL